MTWNPTQYLKFKSERTQPSIDLVSRIALDNPKSIIDIGCGPGNSTQVLCQRWPEAEVAGLDNSEEMIKKAQADFPKQKWILADAGTFNPGQKYDLVFSNATLQWLPNHEALIPKLFSFCTEKGAMAVQVPANNESPLHKALLAVSDSQKWRGFTSHCEKLFNYRPAGYYYDLLLSLSSKIDLWETAYLHVLESHAGLIEWYRSTGMRPFLERLPDDASRKLFEGEVLEKCQSAYPPQKDVKILYPFKRTFFIAYR
jgi:trans-aconitate 2-methyltransferase